MRIGTFIGVVAGGLLAMGCLPGGSTLKGGAFVHPKFPYAVTYDDENKKSLLGDDWLLENYRVQKMTDGKVELERKDGYETTYELDFDDDNKTDAKQDLPLPDLLLTHRKTDARLEVSTILLDRTVADKELRVLLNNIVESQSGTRSLFAGFGRVGAAVSKHYATRLIDSQEATLGGEKGLVATIERADVDQLQLNKEARARRSRLFLMRAPFHFQYSSMYAQGGKVTEGHEYSVLLLVEYTNSPVDFDAQYPDFVRLLSKVHILTDTMLVEYLGAVVLPCAGKSSTTGWLEFSISASGAVSWKDSSGFDVMCVGNAIGGYYGAATGQSRNIKGTYDFTKPQKPAWLAQPAYLEERPNPAAGKPEAAAAGPPDAATPPDIAPAAQAGAAPATPSAAPATNGTPAAPTTQPTAAPPAGAAAPAAAAPPAAATPPATAPAPKP